MLTVTNAFSPHLLPFPLRPDFSSNQSSVNYANAHALVPPVVQTSQKHFGAAYSTFNPLYSMPGSTKMPTNASAAFQASTPTPNAVFSPVTAAQGQGQGFELRFPAPSVNPHLPSMPQGTVGLAPAIPCHFNSTTSTQMDLARCQQIATLGKGLRSGSTLMGNRFQTPSQVGSVGQLGYKPGTGYPPQIAFVHPQRLETVASSLEPNCVLGQGQIEKDTDNIKSCGHELPEDTSPVHSKDHNHSTSSPDRKPLASILTSSNSVPLTNSSIMTSSIYSIIQSTTSTTTSSNPPASLSSDSELLGPQTTSMIKIEPKKETPDETFGDENTLKHFDTHGVRDDSDCETMETSAVENANKTTEGVEYLDSAVSGRLQSGGKSSATESVKGPKVKSLRHSIASILSMNEGAHVPETNLETTNSNEKGDKAFEITIDDCVNEQEGGIVGDDNINNGDISYTTRLQDNTQGNESDSLSISSTGKRISYVGGQGGDEQEDVDVISNDEEHCDIQVQSNNEDREFGDRNSSESSHSSPISYDEEGDVEHTNRIPVTMETDHAADPDKPSEEQHNQNIFHLSVHPENPYKSSQLHMNSHLKRLEGLLTKEESNHFQKDEFFHAKMQILRSASKTNKPGDLSHQVEQAASLYTNETTPISSSAMTTISTLPSFQSPLSVSNVAGLHQCSPFCLCHQNFQHDMLQSHLLQPKEPNYLLPGAGHTQEENQRHLSTVLKEETQKSAFKLIVKKTPSAQIMPMLSPSQTKSNSPSMPALPSGQTILQPPIGIPMRFLGPRSEELKVNHSLPSMPKDSALDECLNLDAISLLRLRSNSYQCPGSLPASFTYSSTTRPNQEAVSVWLSWLRSRNQDSVRNIPTQPMQSVLSKAPPPPRYHCGDCNKTYSTFGGLSKHRQFHCALHVKKEFACKICTKSYSSLGALKMHIRTHTLPCKCHICGKAFSRPWLLQGHVRTHTGEKPFRCNHCGRAFADRSNLRAHLQTHAEIKKYACIKCGKTFSRMSLLTKHSDGSCPANSVSACI